MVYALSLTRYRGRGCTWNPIVADGRSSSYPVPVPMNKNSDVFEANKNDPRHVSLSKTALMLLVGAINDNEKRYVLQHNAQASIDSRYIPSLLRSRCLLHDRVHRDVRPNSLGGVLSIVKQSWMNDSINGDNNSIIPFKCFNESHHQS